MLKKLIVISLILFAISLAACTTNNPSVECSKDTDCMKGGCSHTMCIPVAKKQESGFSTCEYKEEYACYGEVACSCINNKCAWSDQEKLNNCIKEKSVTPTQ